MSCARRVGSCCCISGDEGNLVRRVLGLVEQTDDTIVLEVARFGQSKPGRLEIARGGSERSVRPNRLKYRLHFSRFLEGQFPDEKLDLQVTRVGLNERWRAGIQVIYRQ